MSVASRELTMTEADLQSAVLELLRLRGYRTAHFHDSRREVRPGVFVGDKDAAGFPDIVAVRKRDGRCLIIELKSEKGRLSKAQDEWLLAFEQVEGVEQYVFKPSDWFSGAIKAVVW